MSKLDVVFTLMTHDKCDAVEVNSTEGGTKVFNVISAPSSEPVESWYLEDQDIYLVCTQEIKEYFESQVQ